MARKKKKRFRTGSTPVVPEATAGTPAVADDGRAESQSEVESTARVAPVETDTAPPEVAGTVRTDDAGPVAEASLPAEPPYAAAPAELDELPTVGVPTSAEALHEPETPEPAGLRETGQSDQSDQSDEANLVEPAHGTGPETPEVAPVEPAPGAVVADWVHDPAADDTLVGEPVEPFAQDVPEAHPAGEATDVDEVAPVEPAPGAVVADWVHDPATDDTLVGEPVEPFDQELVDAASEGDRSAAEGADSVASDVAVEDEVREELSPEPPGDRDDEREDDLDEQGPVLAPLPDLGLVDEPTSRAVEPVEAATSKAPVPRPVHGTAAWRRLVRMGLPRATKANVLGGLLAVLLGLAIATQVQLTQERGLSQLSQTDLVRVLDDVSLRSSRLDAQIRELEATRDRLRSGTGSSAEALEQAQKRVDTLGILAGTTAATGPGVVITLSDPESALTGPVILDLIQELRDAGAEAIDVGGVRVVASTFVGEVDGEITIDGVRVTRPIEIKAIGEAKTLSSAMTIPGGIVETVRQKQASATVVEQETVEITSLHEPEDPKNARVVE